MNIKLLSFCIFISTATMANNYQENEFTRTPAGQESCQLNEDTPLLFNVVKNTAEEIVIETGDFKDFFKLGKNEFHYTVHVSGVHEERPGKPYLPKLVKEGDISAESATIKIPVSETGAYIFKLFLDEDKPFWTQKVFSVGKTNISLSAAEKLELAKKYAPILSFTDDEVYYPISLEYLANQVEIDPALGEETFRIVNKSVVSSVLGSLGGLFGGSKPKDLDVEFKFKDILKVLPFYGHHDSVLKFGGKDSSQTRLKQRFGKNHITVYYSIFEHQKQIILNYHFIYPYDLKNGTVEKGVAPAHIFDRESMSIALNASKKPNYVIYGAHLASQTMAQLDDNEKIKQEWKTGRVFVLWNNAKKINDRPVAFIAYGSHGVYPKEGTYGVMHNTTALLKEEAGGSKRFIHPEFNAAGIPAGSLPYKMEDLNLDSVISSCKDARGILAYSGSTVDVLGPTNATFPPFTDREENFLEYLYPDVVFDINK